MNRGSVRSCFASAVVLTWQVRPELAQPQVLAVSLPQQGPPVVATQRLLVAGRQG